VKCQQTKNIQQQYSNVAFQPIPVNNQHRPQPQQQPFMPVVYMPMMANQTSVVGRDMVELQQMDTDEKLARELQAQYDAQV